MTTPTGDRGSAAQASALLDAVVCSESGVDAEVPLRCAVAVALLRSAGIPPVPPTPLTDTPDAVLAALTEAIAHLTAQPDDALSDLMLDAIAEAQTAARRVRSL
jgi:hypothetical protein